MFKNPRVQYLSLLVILFMVSCTPKTVQQATETPNPPKEEVATSPEEGLGPCAKFSDAENPDQAETAHVLYRDFLRSKKYDEAFKYWKKAYELAPAADGKRDYHFLDGIKLYEQKIANETDATQRKSYIQSIFDLYEEAAKCYPDREMMYKGLKAFKLYYSYRDRTTDKEIYEQFKSVIDAEGKKTPDFVVNPFTALMIDQYLSEKISMSEAQKYANQLMRIITYGSENCEGAKACERWDIVKSYAPARLEELEGIEGFYDCSYYKNKYLSDFEANPNDCDIIETTYSRLKWGKCPETDAVFAKLKPAFDKCNPPVKEGTPVPLCKTKLRDGDFRGAIQCYEEKAEASSDNIKKAQYYLTIAKIYYAHLKKYSSARKYARKALDSRSGWGAPHILIGKLYASSGPLCGPGRGFDSQRVVWVAIDEWNKAKRDAEFASEANKLIARYHQFMPTKEDVFLRNLKVGSAYTVPCWIQQSTTIRTAD